jgi:hypothetical protein
MPHLLGSNCAYRGVSAPRETPDERLGVLGSLLPRRKMELNPAWSKENTVMQARQRTQCHAMLVGVWRDGETSVLAVGGCACDTTAISFSSHGVHAHSWVTPRSCLHRPSLASA